MACFTVWLLVRRLDVPPDIMLPANGGWEFLASIKNEPSLKSVPVVVISIAADRNRGFSLGAAAVMQKSISRQELNDSLLNLGLLPLVDGQTLKVLVVDDDPKTVELIAVRVRGLASAVVCAYGGREAIELARRELPVEKVEFDGDRFTAEVRRAMSSRKAA